MINGGIGGLTTTLATRSLNRWIGTNVGTFVVLQFGSDDASVEASAQSYGANLEYMVRAILDAGKVPVLSTPVWASATSGIFSKG